MQRKTRIGKGRKGGIGTNKRKHQEEKTINRKRADMTHSLIAQSLQMRNMSLPRSTWVTMPIPSGKRSKHTF